MKKAKEVLGLMKDEGHWQIIKDFAWLRPKEGTLISKVMIKKIETLSIQEICIAEKEIKFKIIKIV